MIDFNQVNPAIVLTADYILSKLSEEQILFMYHGHFDLGKSFPSRLRKDGNASAGFYISNKTGKLMYHDFKTNEYLNCFQYVGKLLNLRFNEVLERIAGDFGIGGNRNATPLAQHIIDQGIKFDREVKKETKIQFMPAQWTVNMRNYWAQYGLEPADIIPEGVHPVARLFVNKREIKTEELCFAYTVKADKKQKNPYVKIYSPYSSSMKWLSNIPLTVPFGLDTLKYGTDHLIIAKAQKDRMVLKRLGFQSVIGTQNESTSALTDDLVKHLVFNFPRRTIIWDADETGVEACKKFNDKGFGYFNTPKDLLEKDIKDVSDYVAAFGLEALEELLKQKGIL